MSVLLVVKYAARVLRVGRGNRGATAHGSSRARAEIPGRADESEYFAQQVAEALTMMAQAQGVRVRTTVVGDTVLAEVADGGCFLVTIVPAGAPTH